MFSHIILPLPQTVTKNSLMFQWFFSFFFLSVVCGDSTVFVQGFQAKMSVWLWCRCPRKEHALRQGKRAPPALWSLATNQPDDGSAVVLLWVTEALRSLGMSDQQGSCAMEGSLHGCVRCSPFSLCTGVWANRSPVLTPTLPHDCLSVHLNFKRNVEKRGSCPVPAEYPASQRLCSHLGLVGTAPKGLFRREVPYWQ